ncbi:MAG: hypothetical protein RSB38_07565 [Oscillospiraceae bacterium]
MFGNCFGDNNCLWIIILLVVLFCCCGGNENEGRSGGCGGCMNDCGCCD